VLGFLGTPAWPLLQGYLEGTAVAFDLGALLRFDFLRNVLVSVIVVAGGMGLAWRVYHCRSGERIAQEPLATYLPQGLYTLLSNRFYVDEFYRYTVIRWTENVGRAADVIDRRVLDVIVFGIWRAVLFVAWLYRVLDEFVVNRGFDWICRRLMLLAQVGRRHSHRRVQTMLQFIGLVFVVLLLFLSWSAEGW